MIKKNKFWKSSKSMIKLYIRLSDLNNNVLSAFAYFEEDGRIFIAPLDINDNIDKINKKRYH
jgi:hypothetical protein